MASRGVGVRSSGSALAAQFVHGERGSCVVRVNGAVYADSLMQLRHRCHAELERGTTALVLDFTGMTGCPSALFMVLSRIMAAAELHACSVELVGLVEALTTIAGGSVVGHGRSKSE
jgi:anti-anti-sigma regulatory factor